MAADLPWELRRAIERCLHGVPLRQVARASAALAERYRSAAGQGTPIVRSRSAALAYVAYRLPATYAATLAALLAVREQRPEWQPRTLLDLGAGPGAGIWAAAAVWPSLTAITALDAVPEMLALGRELAAAASHPAVRAATWVAADLLAAPPNGQYDLVLLAYVLGEVAPAAAVERAWSATGGTLVLIEPGTPAGYARVIAARAQLLAAGGFTIAPCPHDAPCPLASGDWCHFAVRLARSRVHRVAKQADLGFEDEKFSYAAISRAPTGRAEARVIRRPQVRPGHVVLALCTRDGLETVTVGRSDRERFKRARKTAWGDSFAAP